MSENQQNTKKTDTSDPDSKYEFQFKRDYMDDWDVHRRYIQSFDAYEAMLIGQVYDSVSNSVDASKITDSYATTLAKERADRVMAKLPEGETQSAGKADVGKAAFMDILRQKWIYPNANAQRPFQAKLNMWQLYSSVYGYMPMFYDWNVSPTGYVGPDCWLWNPRNLIPQQGRTSIADMDYVTALTWVGEKYLQDIIDDQNGSSADDDPDHDGDSDELTEDGGWNIDALKELVKRADKEKTNPDIQKDTQIARNRTPEAIRKGICLATRYEAGEDGEWVTFAPDHGYVEVRRLPNPHKNGRIPFVIKYSQPLFDSFYGLGDFQRAKPLQFARDGLTNFYFKGIKMNLIPPIVANANGVVKHTLDYREGAVMLETMPNSIRRLETSNAGLATYESAQNNLTGSLLSLYGSQNASISSGDSLNPSQGKTPQAINLYSDKEATRDGAERRNLEMAIEELTEGFFSLVVNIGTEDVPVALFSEDINDIIKSGLADVKGLFKNFTPDKSGAAGDLSIDPESLKGVEYRFKIASDSTAKINKDAQLSSLKDFMDTVGKYQNMFQDDPTLKINWPTIMETYAGLSDLPVASEFITVDPKATPPPPPPVRPPTPQELVKFDYKDATPFTKGQIEKMFNLEPDKLHILEEKALAASLQNPPQETPAPVEPTVTQTGQTFNDPTIAQAADALTTHHLSQPLPEAIPAPEPAASAVSESGHMFSDPELAQVADALGRHAAPLPPPKPEPAAKPAKKPATTKK